MLKTRVDIPSKPLGDLGGRTRDASSSLKRSILKSQYIRRDESPEPSSRRACFLLVDGCAKYYGPQKVI